jgi:LPXTG-motif cell wall-anchored protein
VPLNPAPEVEIPEEDVPLVEIPEEEVPLVDVPKTGDASALWLMMSVLSGTGLAGMSILGRKKREEN